MSIIELVLIAVGLSMDAFAVAIGKGLSLKTVTPKSSSVVGAWFGFFQMGMPLVGYYFGALLADLIVAYDHWIAFLLLAVIGGRMIKESRSHDDDRVEDAPLAVGKMLPLAVATSIDALAVGISFAFLRVDVFPAVMIIGATTFSFSVAGMRLGSIFGLKYKSTAELFGGVVLILIGLKILVEHIMQG